MSGVEPASPASPPTPPPPAVRRRPVVGLVVALLAFTALAGAGARALGEPAAPAIPVALVLLVLLVAGEQLRVDVRRGEETESLNLAEAVLAPVVFTTPVAVAVPLVVVAQLAANVMRRNRPLKSAFNIAQWAAATTAAALVLRSLGGGHAGAEDLPALVVAMVVLAVVNHGSFVLVLALSGGRSPAAVLGELAPVIARGWMLGWLVNTSFGVLFALAQDASAVAATLYAVPLVVLHLASRGYARTVVERARLDGARAAARTLSSPVDHHDALPDFLAELCRCFDAESAEIALVEGREVIVHAVTGGDPATLRSQPYDGDVRALFLDEARPDGELSVVLRNGAAVEGRLTIAGRGGLQGFDAVDRAVLEVVARDTAATIAKSRLVGRVLEERRRLAEEWERRRQALVLNDEVVQGLAVAAMALELGEHDMARTTLDRTIASARAIVTGLLPSRRPQPGELAGAMRNDRSTFPASEAGR